MKDGRKTTSLKKFLPSYVLLEMELDKETLHFATNVPGVTSFVGPGKHPQPLRERGSPARIGTDRSAQGRRREGDALSSRGSGQSD